MLIGLMALMGPVSSALTERIGWRAVVMIGGLIASIGTLMAAFATNITHVLICFGIVTGQLSFFTCMNKLYSFSPKGSINYQDDQLCPPNN